LAWCSTGPFGAHGPTYMLICLGNERGRPVVVPMRRHARFDLHQSSQRF
jgi:hypothetical protein